MSNSDLFFFTSVAEGTPHVVLEAISNNLPVLCFDVCGQGDSVNSNVGIKIPITNPFQSVEDFAYEIDYLFYNRNILTDLSENCKIHRKEISWDNKVNKMLELYKQTLNLP
jgi:glycosyltransferase involved in cell wall biosynthesis